MKPVDGFDCSWIEKFCPCITVIPAPSAVGLVLGIVALGLGLVVVGDTQPAQHIVTASPAITTKLANPIVFIFIPLGFAIMMSLQRNARI